MTTLHPLATSLLNVVQPPESLDKTFVAGLVVSTIASHDLGWETAVAVEDGEWHPVERYQTREEAAAGHKRWVERAPELTTVTDLGLGDWVAPREVKLR
ncbi:hypothetical protein K1W54_04725 [Micromonospora sp. CPCC 205371]|nr:hypothetical protein [Micromonospora sp. CPCC 205371]